ncbi:SufS family cysteine desulfurase [Neptuniibacter halophilus]|uniref:SufS family cysteine desulfurase n=1 Tax=Neptuniibacter halophilus TaxID=651666 RepID=UPI0025744764|nr:SufS family cysteine desulfurase [Neptuniibacter halophilus]
MTDHQAAISRIRQQFPILSQRVNGKPLVYFDNAATTQKPRAVIESVQRYYRQYNANVHRASHALSADATAAFEQARRTLASYLNASSSDEIIWTRSTTEAINLVANSWGSSLQPGDEIILSTLEHHANIVPWQMLARRQQLTLRVIPLLDNGDLDLEAYAGLLNDRTRLVAVGHVSNALGTINPVKKIIDMAHAAGALVLVDGAQATPHFRVDLQALDADFYALSGHKLFAPTGIGVLYGKRALLENMPPWQGGGEMIRQVSFEHTTYNDIPFRFEAGTPNIAGVLGLAEAVKWLQAQDHTLLAEQEQALLSAALEGCQSVRGFRRIGCPAESVSLLSFMLDGVHQQDLGLLLDQEGIAVRTGHHCAMPLMQALGLPGTTRASFAFYNTLTEVAQFVDALDRLTRPAAVAPLAVSSVSSVSETSLYQKLLQQSGWNARYREIMLAGKALPSLPAEMKTEQALVKGCESNTWLHAETDNDGKFHFAADSEARIIRGLLALVLDLFNNRSAEEIGDTDIGDIFRQLELQRHLSPSRGNGLRAVIERIYQIAGCSRPEL